jgi:tRNA(fMet)-specific endonuclease VapC
MQRFMLDTNTAGYVIKGTVPAIRQKLLSVPMAQVCISVITQAELLFGVLRKPEATRLKVAVRELLQRVEILAWDADAAESYAFLRRQLELDGTALGSMDMLIAAHSIAADALLVTNDRAFFKVRRLPNLVDWSTG